MLNLPFSSFLHVGSSSGYLYCTIKWLEEQKFCHKVKTIFCCCNLLSSSVTVTKLVTFLISLEEVVQMRSGSKSYKGAKEFFWIVLGIPHVVMLVLYSFIPQGKRRWWLTVMGQYYISGAITNFFFFFPPLSSHCVFIFCCCPRIYCTMLLLVHKVSP